GRRDGGGCAPAAAEGLPRHARVPGGGRAGVRATGHGHEAGRVSRVVRALAPTVAILAALGLWEGLCRGLGVQPSILPPPSAIALARVQHLPLLLHSAWNTFALALIALAVASTIATSLAVSAALSRLFERSFRPVAVAIQVTPVVALAPLIQVWAGIDHPQV